MQLSIRKGDIEDMIKLATLMVLAALLLLGYAHSTYAEGGGILPDPPAEPDSSEQDRIPPSEREERTEVKANPYTYFGTEWLSGSLGALLGGLGGGLGGAGVGALIGAVTGSSSNIGIGVGIGAVLGLLVGIPTGATIGVDIIGSANHVRGNLFAAALGAVLGEVGGIGVTIGLGVGADGPGATVGALGIPFATGFGATVGYNIGATVEAPSE
jgi:hypothetical protein